MYFENPFLSDLIGNFNNHKYGLKIKNLSKEERMIRLNFLRRFRNFIGFPYNTEIEKPKDCSNYQINELNNAIEEFLSLDKWKEYLKKEPDVMEFETLKASLYNKGQDQYKSVNGHCRLLPGNHVFDELSILPFFDARKLLFFVKEHKDLFVDEFKKEILLKLADSVSVNGFLCRKNDKSEYFKVVWQLFDELISQLGFENLFNELLEDEGVFRNRKINGEMFSNKAIILCYILEKVDKVSVEKNKNKFLELLEKTCNSIYKHDFLFKKILECNFLNEKEYKDFFERHLKSVRDTPVRTTFVQKVVESMLKTKEVTTGLYFMEDAYIKEISKNTYWNKFKFEIGVLKKESLISDIVAAVKSYIRKKRPYLADEVEQNNIRLHQASGSESVMSVVNIIKDLQLVFTGLNYQNSKEKLYSELNKSKFKKIPLNKTYSATKINIQKEDGEFDKKSLSFIENDLDKIEKEALEKDYGGKYSSERHAVLNTIGAIKRAVYSLKFKDLSDWIEQRIKRIQVLLQLGRIDSLHPMIVEIIEKSKDKNYYPFFEGILLAANSNSSGNNEKETCDIEGFLSESLKTYVSCLNAMTFSANHATGELSPINHKFAVQCNVINLYYKKKKMLKIAEEICAKRTTYKAQFEILSKECGVEKVDRAFFKKDLEDALKGIIEWYIQIYIDKSALERVYADFDIEEKLYSKLKDPMNTLSYVFSEKAELPKAFGDVTKVFQDYFKTIIIHENEIITRTIRSTLEYFGIGPKSYNSLIGRDGKLLMEKGSIVSGKYQKYVKSLEEELIKTFGKKEVEEVKEPTFDYSKMIIPTFNTLSKEQKSSLLSATEAILVHFEGTEVTKLQVENAIRRLVNKS